MKERHMGIEWLRIISMYMVVVLHILGQGGILTYTAVGTIEYQMAWLLEIACYGAVNCYALISGYVGWQAKFRYRKFGKLWGRIVFYTLVITTGIWLWRSELVGKEQWFAAIFPIINKQYWYMTAYAGLFVLMPVLNTSVNQMKQRDLGVVCLMIVIVFSVFPTAFNVSVFGLTAGYSMLWLVLLYLIGGFWGKYGEIYIQKSTERIPRWGIKLAALCIYFICTIITWVLKINGNGIWVKYTSPTIFIGSAALFVLFSDIKPGKTAGRIAGWFAPSALSVYMIHVHPLIWENIVHGFAKEYPQRFHWTLPMWVLLTAFGIYVGCTFLDLPRAYIRKIFVKF